MFSFGKKNKPEEAVQAELPEISAKYNPILDKLRAKIVLIHSDKEASKKAFSEVYYKCLADHVDVIVEELSKFLATDTSGVIYKTEPDVWINYENNVKFTFAFGISESEIYGLKLKTFAYFIKDVFGFDNKGIYDNLYLTIDTNKCIELINANMKLKPEKNGHPYR